MTKEKSKEIELWADQEYHRQRGSGRNHRQAVRAVNAAGRKKFGAPDWDSIFAFIERIFALFSKFFP